MDPATMDGDTHMITLTEDLVVKEISRPRRRRALWFTDNWRAVLSELVSTMLLLFLGCMCCIPINGFPINPPMYSTIGFGLIVLINVQTFGHISGAHMNPSVTLAAVIWGKISIGLGIAYVVAQCSGAVLGYGILMVLSPKDLSSGVCTTQPHETHTEYQALGVEIILTVALVLINCAVWDPVNEGKDESNSVKFGLTVAGLSVAGGPLTGASMNPARSLGPAVWTNIWNAHWVYWAGPLVGSLAAVLFYKYIWLRKHMPKETEVLTWTGSRNFIDRV